MKQREEFTIGGFIYLIGSVIATVGFIMPFWHLYRVSNSGEVIRTYTVTENSRPFRPFEIDLDSQMNPLLFDVSATVNTSRHSSTDWYRGTLYLGNSAVAMESIIFSSKPDSFGFVMAPARELEVTAAGRYRYVVDDVNKRNAVIHMEITARRNVSKFEWRYVIWGLVILGCGGLICTFFGDKPDFLRKYD